MPDLYVKKKYKNIPDAPKFYFKKSHIPFVDQFKKFKVDKHGIKGED